MNSNHMNQSRRKAIKQLLAVSAGVALLPACTGNKASTITLHNISITGGEEALVQALAKAILPTTNTPGAAETGAAAFALKMVDDCYTKADQDKFLQGLTAFDSFAQTTAGSAFDHADAAGQSKVLEALEQRKEDDALAYFYSTVKRLTIRAYTTSKYFLTEVEHFKLVPGPVFKGCVPVQQA